MGKDITAPYNIHIMHRGMERDFYCLDENSFNESVAIFKNEIYPVGLVANVLGGEKKIIFDIGANMGAFSLICSRFWPESEIYSFEPNADSFSALRHNVANIPEVTPFFYGLARGNHRVPIQNSTSGSVGASVGVSRFSLPPTESIELRDAGQTAVALGVSEIDVLKIDTEGCEVPIIESLGKMANSARTIMLEYHSDEDRSRLDELLRCTHCIYGMKAVRPHRGELFYVRRDLMDPFFETTRIELPSVLR